MTIAIIVSAYFLIGIPATKQYFLGRSKTSWTAGIAGLSKPKNKPCPFCGSSPHHGYNKVRKILNDRPHGAG